MKLRFALLMATMTASPASAQLADFRSSCVGEGVVFRGVPTERITLGEDPPTEVTTLRASEASEFEVVISCEAERLVVHITR